MNGSNLYQTRSIRPFRKSSRLFQLQAVFESIADRFTENHIFVVERIEGDRLEFGHIDVPVLIQDAFVRADVDNLAFENTGFLIIGNQFAFKGERKFLDNGSIYKG